MEKIITTLKEIIMEQLENCKKNKTVPSKELLDTIETLNLLQNIL